MGYNLQLACFDCHARGYVSRTREAESIALWAKMHPEHRKGAAVDNGFAEAPWIYEDGWREFYLPDDLRDGS